MTRLGTMTALLALLAGPACAQQILRAEPPPGQLKSGETVLVDDGRCPAGQVREVSAARQQKVRDTLSAAAPPASRSRRCVPRPR